MSKRFDFIVPASPETTAHTEQIPLPTTHATARCSWCDDTGWVHENRVSRGDRREILWQERVRCPRCYG